MTHARTVTEALHLICASEGPLNERLTAFTNVVREFSLPFAEAYDQLVARLEAGNAGAAALGIGELMPPFVLPDDDDNPVCLREMLDFGPAIVSFNWGHWSEYCAIERTTLLAAQCQFAQYGAHVVCIMPQAKEPIADAKTLHSSAIKTLADVDNSYALSLGLVVWLGEAVRKVYLEHAIHSETFKRSGAWFVPIPATFVVGPDGRIAARHVDTDPRRRMEINDILLALRQVSLTPHRLQQGR